MDKELAKFLSGETNFYKGELSIGRESIVGKPTSYFIMKSGDVVLKEWWGTIGKKPQKQEDKESKSMGGKKPYTMLMSEKLQQLRKDGKLKLDELGFLTALTPNIEWGTGKIIDKRSKEALTAKDIEGLLGISHNTLNRYVKGLKEIKLLTVSKDGYFISAELFKKGSSKL